MTELLILLYCLPGAAIGLWHLVRIPPQQCPHASAGETLYALSLVVLWPLWLWARRHQ